MITLVTKDSKGKIRVAELSYEWNDEQHAYVIHRTTFQFGGKRTQQPDKTIAKGKAKRTVTEQVQLEFAHLIKEYKDKGYKELENSIDSYTPDQLYNIIGEEVTGASGIVKPMLAKQADKVTSKTTFDKPFYGSRKINGVRCLIYLGQDGKLHTSSRGATDYDGAILHIIRHPLLVKLFKQNPWLIMDGEIYHHGWTLNKISGVCRTQVTAFDADPLEFYWYDIVDTNRSFKERLLRMNAIKNVLNLGFDPYREWNHGEDLQIQFVPQVLMSGYDEMMKYHNKYVSEGWEGLVVRDASKPYKPAGRSNDMIKIKVYKDSEYEIVGLSEGLREEDLCFIMKTESGQEFKAKPMGDRAQKQWYRDHIEELIGQFGTLKYFEMSGKEGSDIPQQPIFICVRNYE